MRARSARARTPSCVLPAPAAWPNRRKTRGISAASAFAKRLSVPYVTLRQGQRSNERSRPTGRQPAASAASRGHSPPGITIELVKV